MKDTQLINEAIARTAALVEVMEQENQLLKTHERGEAFEAIIKEKRLIGAKVEKLLSEVKRHKDVLKGNEAAAARLPELQVVVDKYQTTARKNVVLLQAAHQTTMDVINIFRKAVERVKPKAETYTKDGKMSSGDAAGTLITKSV